MPSNQFTRRVKQARNIAILLTNVLIIALINSCSVLAPERSPLINVETILGQNKEFGEPFGLAHAAGVTYLSDGELGTVSMISANGVAQESGFDTPSGICIGSDGKAVVADSGRNAIYRLDPNPTIIAGGSRGNSDGDASSAGFNSPIGVACVGSTIFVADTYNDRIRVIENGKVRTLAGSVAGYLDGTEAKFDTPVGIAAWHDKLLVADTGNRRIRVVEADGRVWTLAGSGDGEMRDGSLLSASFVQPTAIAVDARGSIFIADGNSIRTIAGPVPVVRTLVGERRGLADGPRLNARFNRISGLAFDAKGDLLIADSENRLLRRLTSNAATQPLSPQAIAAMRATPSEFRAAAPGRWPYDPPTAKRDVAGTLGEIRGEITENSDPVWFHNGLDIAGAYGETARFVRDEKVLRPVAAENFNTLRELLRLPTLGYIHIRLGRDPGGKPLGDERFQFQTDASGKLVNVRVPRGSKFAAGEAIGTLNPMNHVHLVAGRSGAEMNALNALDLPGFSDTRAPVIEKVSVFDQNWAPVETVSDVLRIKNQVRIVVRSYDQVDGNAERRRLGVYKLGYQVLRKDGSPLFEPRWNISFERMPANEAVRFAYGSRSHSGATGETIFNYIVTNHVDGDEYGEGFLDTNEIGTGSFILRVFAADHSGNVTPKDIEIEVYQ